jgi:hypothetical protein
VTIESQLTHKACTDLKVLNIAGTGKDDVIAFKNCKIETLSISELTDNVLKELLNNLGSFLKSLTMETSSSDITLSTCVQLEKLYLSYAPFLGENFFRSLPSSN